MFALELHHEEAFARQGFFIFPEVFTAREVADLRDHFEQATSQWQRDKSSLHAIRRVMEALPGLKSLIMVAGIRRLLNGFAASGSFLTKSIYFDKPAGSNWFVAWHQDLSITVAERINTAGYTLWTSKEGVIGVVPPLHILQATLTVRIHLDDTDETNGALRVVAGSHLEGIVRKEVSPWDPMREHTCAVPAGGVMLMRPLTMHASRRSTSGSRRRVLHLEFCNLPLDGQLRWGERMEI